MMKTELPVGQQARLDFPRFGVTSFANYSTSPSDTYTIQVGGDVKAFSINQDDLNSLKRVDIVADFHCVTTWSYCGVKWSGFRFRDVYEQLIKPQVPANRDVNIFAFRAYDKYKSSLLTEDALADSVFLVDSLNNEPLSSKHGAPLRVIAPAHYGYKSVKHLRQIEVWQDTRDYRPLNPRIMEHPHARVAYEERGRYFPGWLLRYIYRPLINSTVRQMNQNNS